MPDLCVCSFAGVVYVETNKAAKNIWWKIISETVMCQVLFVSAFLRMC